MSKVPVENKEKEISSILKAMKIVQEQKDFDRAIKEILEVCMELVGAKAGLIVLKDSNEKATVLVSQLDENIEKRIHKASKAMNELYSIIYSGETIYENDFQNSKYTKLVPENIKIKNVVFVPLKLGNKVAGVFGLMDKEKEFFDHDVYLINAFSEVGSLAISNRKLISRLEISETTLKKQMEKLDDLVKEQSELLIQREIFSEIGNISSELAHDLRSPLQTIQNATYLLEMKPDRKELLNLIKESLSYATSILDSFREYYRGHEITPINIDLTAVVKQAVYDIEAPDGVGVELELEEIGKVTIDPTKIRRAINNLVKNAFEAMPEGGELTVTLKEEDEKVVIEIVDTGEGIPEEIQENLYRPFDSRKPGGSGLGLPSAKRIIESHGGSIEYETTHGMGTRFKISLPKKIEEL
jgi:signal transduction histidine kinase